MQAVDIKIGGSYWDSFLYNDRLYLFRADGVIETYAWDRLVDALPVQPDLHPVLRHFTARGKVWYSKAVQELLSSRCAADALKGVADRVTAAKVEVTRDDLADFKISATESPAHPHTDVEAFYSNLYISAHSGVHVMQIKPNSSLGTTKLRRIFDGPSFRVAGSYGSLAVAAGDDGLFEARSPRSPKWESHEAARQISESYCAGCSWAAFDLIASSPGAGGYVAAFSHTSKPKAAVAREERSLLGVIDAAELFHISDGLMFGAGDKLVLASESRLFVDTWNPFRRRADFGLDLDRSLVATSALTDSRLSAGVIDGSPAVFGVVVELDEGLLVLGSDGTSEYLDEPVNWRLYPRSARYLNQLHVTYEDHLQILAYVHDYFLPEGARGNFAMKRPFMAGYGSV